MSDDKNLSEFQKEKKLRDKITYGVDILGTAAILGLGGAELGVYLTDPAKPVDDINDAHVRQLEGAPGKIMSDDEAIKAYQKKLIRNTAVGAAAGAAAALPVAYVMQHPNSFVKRRKDEEDQENLGNSRA